MKQFFYVYRITIDKKYHYYGARSTNTAPADDLGKKYFSSSNVVNSAIKMNKEVKYKIIKQFSTFEDALRYEIKLHCKFNVQDHRKFLNRRNQTSIYFMHSTKDKVAVFCPKTDEVEYIHKDKIQLFLSLGYKKGLPDSKLINRRGKTGTFLHKKHSESTKLLLSKKRSIQIKVEFKNGIIVTLPNRLKLGEYLGMSPQLGARLVREVHRKDLWDKYNIKDIIRL